MEARTDSKTKPNMARPMAYDYLEPIIPAHTVIPAQAGIQTCCEVRASFTTALDTRLRGYDDADGETGSVDTAETGGIRV